MSGNGTYERHELSEKWGDMPAKEFRDLVEDVRKNGVLHPVTLYEGKVLDGWQRYRAALEAGVECPAQDYTGDDPAGFVITANHVRRHLTPEARTRLLDPGGGLPSITMSADVYRRHLTSAERAKCVERVRKWKAEEGGAS